MEYGTYKIVRGSDGRFSSYWKKIKWFSTRVFIGVGVSFLLLGVYIAGAYGNPVVKAELIKEGLPPILAKIAKCESGDNHFDKNGQVLMRSNTNRSVDLGKYQINSVWFAKATELGLDLTLEADNEEFAIWLYRNRGTGDWSASANCWRQ